MKKSSLLMLIVAGVLFVSASLFAYTANKRTAEVEQQEGLYLFIKSKPVDPYDYKGTITLKTVKTFKVNDVVPKIIRLVKENHPEANAIIFTEENLWKADAVVLK